jgi:N-acetylneuraminic acid mutarotase
MFAGTPVSHLRVLLISGLIAATLLSVRQMASAQESAANEWTWMGGSNSFDKAGAYGTLGTSAAGNVPGGRYSASSWTDSNGHLWLFGGFGVDGSSIFGNLNDLWEFNPATSEWIWKGGSSSTNCGSISGQPNYCGQPGVYGTLNTPAPGNVPGARTGASSWTDTSGDLWLFGGNGFDANRDTNYLNDLWKFNPSTNQWTWMGGSNTIPVNGEGQPGVYGTLGTPAAGNIPGARTGAASWTDNSGHFWLFGGSSIEPANFRELNDLWEFDPTTNQWTWMGGSNTIPGTGEGQPGVYGTLGTPAAGNVPGGRSTAVSWTDSSGNLWLFGGLGVDASGNYGSLNDLWAFNPSTNEWTWMGGGNKVPCIPENGCTGNPGVYGTLGVPATGNIPGGRAYTTSWTDSGGNFWLFGGDGFDANPGELGYLNDLWEFNPSTNEWAWMGGSSTAGQPGVYGTLGSPAAGNIPGGRAYASSWSDGNGHLWLFGGDLYGGIYGDIYLNDIWEYQPSVPAKTTPTVTVTPLTSSITTAQSLSVTVAVNGTPAPTGSVTLTGGGFTSVATTLTSGTATINIPAGSLATGTDTLTATYVPDSNSSSTYNSASGTSSAVTVSQAKTTPTVTVTPLASSITTAQSLSVTVAVNGTPAPTGSVTLTGGGFTSVATTLASGTATINIPAGSLAVGSDTLTASYTPDTNSSSTYNSATGTSSAVTVTAPAKTVPTVIVTLSASSITTAQPLSVTVAVSGGTGNPTPTGSLILTGGGYTSATTTLTSGTATISIPAGSLAVGNDTLTVTYTPDSGSSPTYNSAVGTSSAVTVTQAKTSPIVTVTPASSSITTAQPLSVTVAVSGTPTPTGLVILTGGGYTSATTTLTSGTASINIPAGSLAVGSDTLTATYTPDSGSSSTYNSAMGTSSAVTVTAVTTAPVPITSGISPAYADAGGAAFTLTVTGSGFTTGSTVYWGTSALTTTYVGATQLTAQVPATDIVTGGITAAISVITPSPGGGTSNSFQFEVDSASGSTTGPQFSSVTQTVTAGSSASYPVTLPSAVESASVTCLNLPAGASCSYSSTTNVVTITTSSTTPVGTYQITVVFLETESGAASAGILLPILLLPLVVLRKRLAARGIWTGVCMGMILVIATAFSTGCGGGGSSSSGSTTPPPATHQVTSSGAVNLTVQ